MKKILLPLLITLFCISAKAQDNLNQLINDGIALNDKGDFDAAVAKFDAALQLDPSSYKAMYEKSYTLLALNRYDESEDLVKKVLKESKDTILRRLSWLNYGTIWDYKGDGKKSLKIYNEGLKEFPGYYLLYFNKGISQAGMKDLADAAQSFEQSLTLNPYHASSHNALGRLMIAKSRVPAILSFFSFLLVEPTGKRAEANLTLFNQLLMQGVQKNENGNVTISIDAAMLDSKKKSKEDDFSSAELILSLTAANDNLPDSLGLKTDADKLSYKLQTLISVIGETAEKKDKGFYKHFYVPFFVEMKKNNLLTTACYIALSSAGKEDNMKWLKENEEKLNQFNEWFRGYKWQGENEK